MELFKLLFLAGASYFAFGLLYLCLRERKPGLGFYNIIDAVVWWLPEIITGKMGGTKWRTQPVELLMGAILAVSLFVPIAFALF